MSDTDSIDSVISTLYAVISGPAGEKRDWQRNNALFFPGARVVRTLKGEDGIPVAKAMTTEEYAQSTQKYFDEKAFFETEIARRTDRFGNIAQILSTYESRHHPEDPQPFNRGINSIQLYNDGDRWWVVSIIWDSERADNPILNEYLPA